MLILPDAQKVAIIDPRKKMGEEGQYTTHTGSQEALETVIGDAREAGMELRYYYTDMSDGNGENVPIKVIVTEIPPYHVQPFHTHSNVHEVSTVLFGEVVAVDSDTLVEANHQEIEEVGTVVKRGGSIIADRGVRHTVANFSDSVAVFITQNVLPLPKGEDFEPDWK
ncbi:cupin domain-containing protein [Candidatus Parcubacteria bacterium]|jgi:quercetin dioxygenase-like cupin family protein|nr:cupin domain-containing protein [Candidatus Parcubacteria bacterium]